MVYLCKDGPLYYLYIILFLHVILSVRLLLLFLTFAVVVIER